MGWGFKGGDAGWVYGRGSGEGAYGRGLWGGWGGEVEGGVREENDMVMRGDLKKKHAREVWEGENGGIGGGDLLSFKKTKTRHKRYTIGEGSRLALLLESCSRIDKCASPKQSLHRHRGPRHFAISMSQQSSVR